MSSLPQHAASVDELRAPVDAEAAELRAVFDRHGAVWVEGLLEAQLLGRFRDLLAEVVAQRLRSVGAAVPPSGDLDARFDALCAVDRRLGGEVYDLCRELEPLYELLRWPGIVARAKTLVGTSALQIPHQDVVFRIDRPGETRFLFGWHQDYPYNVMSRSAVTVWAPLTDVSPAMGPLRIVPGSHRHLQRYVVDRGYAPGGAGHSSGRLRLALDVDLDALALDLPLAAGSVLFFHSGLLHRSGDNRGERSRWVFNARYGDLWDAALVERGWQIKRPVSPGDTEVFARYHPDLVEEG